MYPGDVVGVPGKDTGGLGGDNRAVGQRANGPAAAVAKLPGPIESVVNARVELHRVALSEGEMNRATAIVGVLDIGPLLSPCLEVDQQPARCPAFAQVVREHPGGLGDIIVAAEEVIDAACGDVFSTEQAQI